MSVVYTWSFPQFDCAKLEDGLTDVVKTIHWRFDGTDGFDLPALEANIAGNLEDQKNPPIVPLPPPF